MAQDYDSQDRSRYIIFPTRSMMEGTVLIAVVGGLFLACLIFYGLAAARKRKFRSVVQCHHVVPSPTSFDSSTEVVIVGAGVLGSAVAAVLARDGRRVTVVERDLAEPDRIVGELLQPGGYRALKKLGLQAATEGIDCHVVHGYVVHNLATNTSVDLSYPQDRDQNVMTGRSYHHGRFIMGLRREAQEAGVTLVEGTVHSLLEDREHHITGVSYKNKSSGEMKTIRADLTIVADGCFSRFRKDLTEGTVSVASNFAGLIMHNCPQFKANHAEIVLGNTGPILVYQIASNDTRILVDIQGKMPSDPKEYMMKKILPQLPDYMQGPFAESLKENRIRSMPNSFLPPVPNPKPGCLILGDAFNMRHPLTGAGMSVALNDVVIWREMLSTLPDLKDHSAILKSLKVFHWRRKGSHSFVVNVLAQALYALFSASDVYLEDLRQACFEYFKLGGAAVSGPVGLLSVLKPHPFILIGHFFAVALFAIYRTFKAQQLWRIDKGLFRSVMIFKKACTIIFPLIASELSSVILS